MSDLGSNIEPEVAIPVRKAAKQSGNVGLPKTTRIILEESEDIPPTGLFVGVNGRGYIIRAGEEVDVPESVLDVLKNAVMSMPQLDPQTKQVLGYRERMRYPYRVVSDR